ncbi:acid sphingomyelinase-like phosphodiesterase 3b [Caerostris extrusa]|uniref:Acid sphingomyelinase-like phosphodiesterase 3b n=1 Tax=Caerostris extrusa TaxID=172846 RepID=A0AAV4MAX0_CAEEX|nr:acid sphingomyelinase-like phosphodiesterase 3b [Caerostris extrusa]
MEFEIYVTHRYESHFCPLIPKLDLPKWPFKENSTFWHITDTHVDQNYSRSGNALNMCHKNPNIRRNNVDNGLYGNFLCDSPQYLINATILSMKYIQPTPDFIIWTGDNLPHSLDFIPDWDVTFEAIRNTTFMLRSSFPDITILPSIGNHDTFPPNILPTDTSANNIYKGYLEKGGWKDLIIENQWPTFVQGGYYSHLLKSGFRIISLNTILWYSPNNLTEKMPDPGNQFRWLEGLLKNSSRLSEKVYIIGHVPPGYYNRVNPGQKSDSTFHPQHLESYLKLLLKYSPVIVGQFYGHLHMDMFQVFQYDTEGAVPRGKHKKTRPAFTNDSQDLQKLLAKREHLLQSHNLNDNTDARIELNKINAEIKRKLLYAIQQLDFKKSPGPDGIHGQFIVNLGSCATKRFLHIFNLSWKLGRLPRQWKTAIVVPIRKPNKDASCMEAIDQLQSLA